MMRVVSEQSDEDVARRSADLDVQRKLRRLAANILRCCAGGGKPNYLPREMAEFLHARFRQSQAYGYTPALGSVATLSASAALQDHRDWVTDGSHADCPIAREGMRLHAAYLLDQMTHVSLAEGRMHDAIIAEGYERARPSPRA